MAQVVVVHGSLGPRSLRLLLGRVRLGCLGAHSLRRRVGDCRRRLHMDMSCMLRGLQGPIRLDSGAITDPADYFAVDGNCGSSRRSSGSNIRRPPRASASVWFGSWGRTLTPSRPLGNEWSRIAVARTSTSARPPMTLSARGTAGSTFAATGRSATSPSRGTSGRRTQTCPSSRTESRPWAVAPLTPNICSLSKPM